MSEPLSVVYFDQLLCAVRNQKLVELFFSAVFSRFQSFLFFLKQFTLFTPQAPMASDKKLKKAEKSSSTSIQVHAAPKS